MLSVSESEEMPNFDPTYGALLSPREVSEMTGLTNNQLRNWRIPARRDKAPFGFVQIGASPYYRKIVVEAWLERTGGNNVKFIPAGLDAEFPVDAALENDLTKQKHLTQLATITTANQFLRWSQTISDILKENYAPGLRANQRRLYGMWKGLTPEAVAELTHLPRGKMTDNLEQYYIGSTLAHRRLWADIQGWEITDQELIALPCGDVPPLKETK